MAPRRSVRLAVCPLEAREVPSANPVSDPVSPLPPPFPEVTGRVWRDQNGNGLRDPAEPGVMNLTLGLYAGNTLVATTTTDGLGTYAFDAWNVPGGLLAGTSYEIRVAGNQSALTGLRPTVPNAGTDNTLNSDAVATATGAALDFVMGGGSIYPNNDFGYTTAATIGDTVWADTNNNGVRDLGEAGLAGVTVRLLDSTGTTQVATTTTAADGTYQFTGLVPATYVVEVAATNFATGGPLAGYSSSTGRAGHATGPFEGAATPSPNVSTGKGVCDHGTMTAGGAVQCQPVTVTAGNPTNLKADFGFVRAGTLAGRVYVDPGSSGLLTPSTAAGVAGVKITAAGPAGVFTTTTDSTGAYAFANLPAATYTVTEAPPMGYKSTTPMLVSAAVSPTAPGTANFGQAKMVDLGLKVAATPATVNVGGVITLTYHIWNQGTLDASGVTLTIPLPSGLKVVGSATTVGTLDPNGQRLVIPKLAAGAEATVAIKVKARTAATYALTGIVMANESEDHVNNNRSTVHVTVLPPNAAAATHAAVFLASSYHR